MSDQDQSYPRIVEVRAASGRVLHFTVNGPPVPEIFEHYEPELSPELLEVDEQPDIDIQRPRSIPPWPISRAAERLFETSIPDGHALAHDWGLVRFWWRQRELGLLDD